jgi:hypothetical protein
MGNQCTGLSTFLMFFLLDSISKWIDQRKQFQIYSGMEASIFENGFLIKDPSEAPIMLCVH